MPISQEFPLEKLQLRHPKAFFQPLHYGHIKLIGGYNNPQLHLFSLVCIFILCFCIYTIDYAIQYYFEVSPQYYSLNCSILLTIAVYYPFLYWVQHQAKQSSQWYAQQLQNSIYSLALLGIILFINHSFLHFEQLSIISILIFAIYGIQTIFVESLFKNKSRAIERIQLQKIRQLAYWAYLESRKQHHIPLEYTNHPQQYFRDLQQQALKEEQRLIATIRTKTMFHRSKRS